MVVRAGEEKVTHLLLVEDDEGDAVLLRELLTSASPGSFSLMQARTLSSALDILRGVRPDVILLDLNLPDSRGAESFRSVQELRLQVPVLVLTGLDDEEVAVSLVQEGAQDYIVKGLISGASLVRAIAYAIERNKLIVSLERALREVKTLKGLLPICMHCKKIRDDQGYWTQIERYIEEHSDTEFTHGLCPECAREHYPLPGRGGG